MKSVKYGLIFGVASVMLLAACNFLFNMPSDDSETEKGYGKVNVIITGGQRTVLPAFPSTFEKIEYTFTPTSGAVINKTDADVSGGSITIPVGAYTSLTVKAYIGTSPQVLAGEGTSTSFTVTETGPNNVSVKMNIPATTPGDGTFTYTITYPDTTTLTMTMANFAGGSVTLSTTDTTSGSDKIRTQTLTNLTGGSYVLTVRINDTAGKYAGLVEAVHIYPAMSTTYSKTFTAGDLITPAAYGITLEDGSTTLTGTTHTFTAGTEGSYTPTALTVTVRNTGTQATGVLTAAVSGSDFVITGSPITSIAAGGTSTFTVAPATGLTANATPYTDTVTVSAATGNSNSITAQTFTVSFTVNAAGGTYAISLSETSPYTFTAQAYGYTPSPLTVTVTNDGNQPTGTLAVALTGGSSSNFVITEESSTTGGIAVSGTGTFKVAPKPGLNANSTAYTDTVTVSGSNGISATLVVNFTVTPKVTTFAIDAIADQVYTGTAITPTVVVKDGTTTLTLTTDYTVGYTGNTAVGTATVNVAGAGNYAGSSGTATFSITAPFTLSQTGPLTFTSAAEGYGAQTPETITVTNSNSTLATGALTVALSGTNASSFEITDDSTTTGGIAAGGTGTFKVAPITGLTENATPYTATVTVSGVGTYTATFTVSFTVTAAASGAATIAISWPGSADDPTITGSTSVAKGTPVTITATLSGATSFTWYVDAIQQTATGNTYSFSSYDERTHTVNVVADNDGTAYSAEIKITVTN